MVAMVGFCGSRALPSSAEISALVDTRPMDLDEIAEAIAEVLPGADKPEHEE